MSPIDKVDEYSNVPSNSTNISAEQAKDFLSTPLWFLISYPSNIDWGCREAVQYATNPMQPVRLAAASDAGASSYWVIEGLHKETTELALTKCSIEKRGCKLWGKH